jgi:hypothetical protein
VIDRYASICASCALLRIGPKGGFCEAFPKGIPEAIAFDYFDHRDPFPGDNGIRWRFREGQEEVLRLFEMARPRSRNRVEGLGRNWGGAGEQAAVIFEQEFIVTTVARCVGRRCEHSACAAGRGD